MTLRSSDLRGLGEYPMSTEYTIVIEKDEDGYYVGSVSRPAGLSYPGRVH